MKCPKCGLENPPSALSCRCDQNLRKNPAQPGMKRPFASLQKQWDSEDLQLKTVFWIGVVGVVVVLVKAFVDSLSGDLRVAIGWVFLAGIFFLLPMIKRIREWNLSMDSRNWPPVAGEVIASWVSEEKAQNEFEEDTYYYVPHVVYEYSASGQEYKADKIAVGSPSFDTWREARDVVDRYKTRTKVSVFYDPNNPSQSVLEKGKH